MYLFNKDDLVNYGKMDIKIAQLSRLLVKDTLETNERKLLNKIINCDDAESWVSLLNLIIKK